MLERSRRSSVKSREISEDRPSHVSASNQYTFSANVQTRRPSILQTDTILKMHSAVELNKQIQEKSSKASLVLMNIPTPPKNPGTTDFNCKFPKLFLFYLQKDNKNYILICFKLN